MSVRRVTWGLRPMLRQERLPYRSTSAATPTIPSCWAPCPCNAPTSSRALHASAVMHVAPSTASLSEPTTRTAPPGSSATPNTPPPATRIVLPGVPSTAGASSSRGNAAPEGFVDDEEMARLRYTPSLLPASSDELIESYVNHLMRDGKKALATRHTLEMLRLLGVWLRTPDPRSALERAVELASPLVRMQSRKAGGKITQVPLPLTPRQSRRRGIVAILDASKRRNDRSLATRMAREVCAVLEGQSSVLARKEEAHKVATANRSNASVRI